MNNKAPKHWYLISWFEMDGSHSFADLPLDSKISPENMQHGRFPLKNAVESFLGHSIKGVQSFSYYGRG